MPLPNAQTPGADARTYSTNRQRRTFNEVKVYTNEQPEKCSVLLRMRDGALYEIDEINRAYDPLHFVLLFPCGDYGWRPGMLRAQPARRQRRVAGAGTRTPARPCLVHTLRP